MGIPGNEKVDRHVAFESYLGELALIPETATEEIQRQGDFSQASGREEVTGTGELFQLIPGYALNAAPKRPDYTV